jgi:hypothetical protein
MPSNRPSLRKVPRLRPGAGRNHNRGPETGGRSCSPARALSAPALIVAAARAFTEGDGFLTGQVVDRRA